MGDKREARTVITALLPELRVLGAGAAVESGATEPGHRAV
jgi:hypothetical protein